uniref:Uncharacterized protein n=1 Tax=Molossus molossus TaxID=27622 RepID=A0A7J8BYK5_MOLMO|nr:hypothetical protein HJG59_010082 [Molossus molossus]
MISHRMDFCSPIYLLMEICIASTVGSNEQCCHEHLCTYLHFLMDKALPLAKSGEQEVPNKNFPVQRPRKPHQFSVFGIKFRPFILTMRYFWILHEYSANASFQDAIPSGVLCTLPALSGFFF